MIIPIGCFVHECIGIHRCRVMLLFHRVRINYRILLRAGGSTGYPLFRPLSIEYKYYAETAVIYILYKL